MIDPGALPPMPLTDEQWAELCAVDDEMRQAHEDALNAQDRAAEKAGPTTYTHAHDANGVRLNVGDRVSDGSEGGEVVHIEDPDPDLDQAPYVEVRWRDGTSEKYSLTRDWQDGPDYTHELVRTVAE